MKVVFYFALLILSPFVMGQDDSWRDSLEVARKAYKNENYGKALKYYESAQRKAPDNVDLSDEMAQSAYKARDFERAEKIYQQGGASKQTRAQKSDNLHNLGNSRMRQKDYEGAIDSYKQSLRMNPSDDRTRYNLSEAIRRLNDQKDQKKNNPSDPQDGGGDPQNQNGNQGDQQGDRQGSDGQSDNKQPQGGASNSGGEQKDSEGQLPNQMVERTLDNLARKEAETKRKMMGGGRAGKPSNSGKDW